MVGGAYVDGTELLLGSDNSAGTLGSIQCALALDDSLARSTAAVRPASNLGNGIPVRHVVDVVKVSVVGLFRRKIDLKVNRTGTGRKCSFVV